MQRLLKRAGLSESDDDPSIEASPSATCHFTPLSHPLAALTYLHCITHVYLHSQLIPLLTQEFTTRWLTEPVEIALYPVVVSWDLFHLSQYLVSVLSIDMLLHG